MNWFEAGIILALILLNGIFAGAELALVSARKTRLRARAEAGYRRAQIALELLDNPTQLLSTVQVGITLVGILTGVYGGGIFAEHLEVPLSEIPWVAPHAEGVALASVVAGITYLSLILGELVPKRFALAHAETIAEYAARPMKWMARVARPLVWLLEVSTETVAAILPKKREEVSVTDDDVRALIAEGEQEGVFHRREKEMIDRVLRLADRTVESIMVQRSDIAWLDVDAPIEESWTEARISGHSRFPMCRGDLEQMIGIITLGDLGEAVRAGFDVEKHLHPAVHVPRSANVLMLSDLFRKSSIHIAIVTGEYGEIRGLVTPVDILRAIAGEIVDPDAEQPRAVQRADGSWLVDGGLRIHDVERVLGRSDLAQGEDYHTMAGMVLWHLGRLPEVGEVLSFRDLQIEVVDRDGRKIDKVLIATKEAPAQQSAAGGSGS